MNENWVLFLTIGMTLALSGLITSCRYTSMVRLCPAEHRLTNEQKYKPILVYQTYTLMMFISMLILGIISPAWFNLTFREEIAYGLLLGGCWHLYKGWNKRVEFDFLSSMLIILGTILYLCNL